MKAIIKNIGLRCLSFLLCLQMFFIVAGRTGWVSDVLASPQQVGTIVLETGSVAATASESDTEADDSIPMSSMPDQEKECSEVADYFYVESHSLVLEHFIAASKSKVAVLVDISLQTRLSDITPPPPKPSFV